MPDEERQRTGEKEFETGTDEFFKAHSELTAANEKRTFDAYQDLDIQAARQRQTELANINNIALQALQNAVETANLAGKQCIRHADEWQYETIYDLGNPMATGAADAIRGGIGVSADAVAAAVAKQVDATITPVLATLQQVIQALTTATSTIANVVNQAQPKTT